MSIVHLGLGSNLGDRRSFLIRAIEELKHFAKVLRISDVYESDPWGFEHDNSFLNLVLEIDYAGEMPELLEKCLAIEKKLGRIRSEGGYAGREIDIDILLAQDLVLHTPDLKIPHPGISIRLFVLKPLADLIPGYHHAILGKTITQLLDECPDQSTLVSVECITIT
jgi:2-amino-4-hydroxy-6-hydroxymethyldihydropteridine diphosphokinase